MAEIVIVPDDQVAGELAAEAILRRLIDQPEPVLGLATGSTPTSTYHAMVRRAAGQDWLKNLKAFALDEYVGLPDGHPESYAEVLRREFIEPMGLVPEQVMLPPGGLDGLSTAAAQYEAAIADSGGIDVQILGIGTDGHIGFNEPGSSLGSRTRVKTLAESTRRDNARFFSSLDEVPVHCITQGLGTVLDSRHLILLAFGAHKADAIAAAVEGPVSASLPASVVQLHPHVTVLVDEPAATKFNHGDYYRFAYANKFEWQHL